MDLSTFLSKCQCNRINKFKIFSYQFSLSQAILQVPKPSLNFWAIVKWCKNFWRYLFFQYKYFWKTTYGWVKVQRLQPNFCSFLCSIPGHYSKWFPMHTVAFILNFGMYCLLDKEIWILTELCKFSPAT